MIVSKKNMKICDKILENNKKKFVPLWQQRFFTGQNNRLIMISYMNMQRTDNVVRNWMRSWESYECMGVWEQMQNHKPHTLPSVKSDSQVSVSCASLVEDWDVVEK